MANNSYSQLSLFVADADGSEAEFACLRAVVEEIAGGQGNNISISLISINDIYDIAEYEIDTNQLNIQGSTAVFIGLIGSKPAKYYINEEIGEFFESEIERDFVNCFRLNQKTQIYPFILLYEYSNQLPSKQNNRQEFLSNLQTECGMEAKLYDSVDELRRLLMLDVEEIVAKSVGGHLVDRPDSAYWQGLTEKLRAFSARTLGSSFRERYQPALYVQRDAIRDLFSQFLASEARIMVLVGRAGSGKTAFVADIVNDLNSNTETSAILLNAAYLDLGIQNVSETFDSYLGRILDLETGFLEAIGRTRGNRESHIIVIIDAVNEYSAPEHLLKEISKFTLGMTNSRIKILITCRLPAWNTLKRHMMLPASMEYHPTGANSFVNIDEFSDEEAQVVYDQYRQAYGLKTPLNELSVELRQLIRQPLILKLIATTYQGRSIPSNLSSRGIISTYIRMALATDQDAFEVLQRIVVLIYTTGEPSVSINELYKDPHIGKYITEDLERDTPFTRLINSGALSLGIARSLQRHEQSVLITHELVFTFLLSEVVVRPLTSERVHTFSAEARSKNLPQLRQALIIALGNAISNQELNPDFLISLSHLEDPQIRSILLDTLEQLANESLNLAGSIVRSLRDEPSNSSNLLGLQAAYLLRRDEEVIQYTLGTNIDITELATFYLYMRWNKFRLDGHLTDSYALLEPIAKSLKLTQPARMSRAVTSLVTMSQFLFQNIIHEAPSLLPLLQLLRKSIRAIPGLARDPNSKSFLSSVSNRIADMFISSLANSLTRLQSSFEIANTSITDISQSSPEIQRALMDYLTLIDLDDLNRHETTIRELLNIEHPAVRFNLFSIMLYHFSNEPERHLSFLRNLLDKKAPTNIERLLPVLKAASSALVCRSLRGETLPRDFQNTLEEHFQGFWLNLPLEFHQLDSKEESATAYTELLSILSDLLTNEAITQAKNGNISGSLILPRLVESLDLRDKWDDAQGISFLKILESIAFLGSADFVCATIVNQELGWLRTIDTHVMKVLAKIRSVYREEVDQHIILTENPNLIFQVQASNVLPERRELATAFMSRNLMAAGCDLTTIKLWGVIQFLLISDSSLTTSISEISKVLLTGLYDSDFIDEWIAIWHRVHNPSWNNFKKWNIQPKLLTNDNRQFTGLVTKFVQEKGLGSAFT